MSRSTQSVEVAHDTWVTSGDPSKPNAGTTGLRLQDTDKYAYLMFAKPFRQGQTVVSATLHVYTKGAWSGTTQVTAQRAADSWNASRTNYNNKPGVTGTTASLSQGSPANNQEFAIDVTALMQSVANGAKWFGFRLSTAASTDRILWSANAPHHKPWLEVVWSEAPEQPTDLSPAGGQAVSLDKPTVSARYRDNDESTELAALQVQVHTSNAFTDPGFDSGQVAATEPELDLSAFTYARSVSVTKSNGTPNLTVVAGVLSAADVGATITGTGIPGSTTITAATLAGTSATMSGNASTGGATIATVTRTFPGVTAGQTRYWRIRLQDSAGNWSPWSDVETWNRDTKGTLTINNPAAAPNDYVDEMTPEVTWSFSGETQTAWKVKILDGDDLTNVLHDSGKTKGTETEYTLPAGVLTDPGGTYVVQVVVWDTKNRATTPGDYPFTVAQRTFHFEPDATVDPVSSITVTQITPAPWVEIEAHRGTQPDRWALVRDGVVVRHYDGDDIFDTGTRYEVIDRNAEPRRSHDWELWAVVNGKTSDDNPSAALTVVTEGIWVYADFGDGDVQFMLDTDDFGDPGSWSSQDQGATRLALNSARPNRVTYAVGGPAGSVSGVLKAIPELGTTLHQQRQAWNTVKAHPGRKVTLAMGTEAFDCVVWEMLLEPVDEPNLMCKASFQFAFDDDLPFKVRY